MVDGEVFKFKYLEVVSGNYKYRRCNRAVKRVPGGVICTNGLASEGVQSIWYRR